MQALSHLLSFVAWPLWVGVAVLIAAAVHNHFTNRVPNALTLNAIAAAWVVAIATTLPGAAPPIGGDLVTSFLCTVAALTLLVPFYAMNVIPAGCIKTQMALSAWIGCALPFGSALALTVSAAIAGGIVTAIGVYLYYRKYRDAAHAWDKAREPDAGAIDQPPPLFPIQLTLSLGSLCGILLAAYLGFG